MIIGTLTTRSFSLANIPMDTFGILMEIFLLTVRAMCPFLLTSQCSNWNKSGRKIEERSNRLLSGIALSCNKESH
jgi:hypothetical protein